jgi:uncharacterized protein (TIGR02118 family)
MMKSIGLMTRKTGLTREEFRAYYEERHAPLAIKYFPFRKYVRNHVVLSEPSDIDFDVVSEFYMDTPEVAAAAYSGPVAALMSADEANFMNSAMTRPVVVEEKLIAGAPRGEDTSASRRAMFLLRDNGGEARADRLAACAQSLTDAYGARRTTIDAVAEGLFGVRPVADGFVSVWLAADAPMPLLSDADGFVLVSALLTEVEESPAALMARAYGAGANG